MTTGLILGLLTLWYTWRPHHGNKLLERENVNTAGLLGALYWVTALSGWCYPTAAAVDPPGDPGEFPQFVPFCVCFGVVSVAWGLERRRMAGEGALGKGRRIE